MLPIALLAVLLIVCARLAFGKAQTPSVMGWLLVLAGISAFAIRLQHAGPYFPPEEGNLRAALLALGVGIGLSMEWGPQRGPIKILVRIALGISPILLFFALYSTLAEMEEVVVLRTTPASGGSHDLRLWIVDFDDAAWVTMPRRKAEANGLVDTRAELLRDGEWRCVKATQVRDRDSVNRVHVKRHANYAVQRLATSIGLFDRTAKPDEVAVRLQPCGGE